MIRVAQCWDDGVATDIRLTEILRKYNAKATFFDVFFYFNQAKNIMKLDKSIFFTKMSKLRFCLELDEQERQSFSK